MIYACDACRFLFERTGKTERCPDCGKFNIRPANNDEITEYKNRRLEKEINYNGVNNNAR